MPNLFNTSVNRKGPMMVLALCLAVITSPCFAQWDNSKNLPAVDDDWSRYESDNFELYSDNSERDARSILRDLEILRGVFLQEMELVERNRLPVTVYAFDRDSDYEAYTRRFDQEQKSTAGVYLRRQDRAIIMLRPMDDRESARRVVFHEYVHHMFLAIDEDPPIWFNEGMAELLAGIKIKKDGVEIGHPVSDRIQPLLEGKPLPLATLFTVSKNSRFYNSDSHAGLFYAQSWAILHYWKFGKSKLDPEAVDRFMAVAGRKEALERTNIQSLFEECFGMDYAQMEKDLSRYIRRGRYNYSKVPLPDIPGPESYRKEDVDAAHIRIRLAELAVRMRSDAIGLLVLIQEGEAANADPRIFETLGAEAWGSQDFDAALQYWRQAFELGSNNSVVMREVARVEWKKWFSNFLPTLRLPPEVVVDLRKYLVTSIQLEPVQDEAYEMLAWVEGFSDKPNIANTGAVQQRFKLMKKKARTLLALSVGRERLGYPDQAIEMLKEIHRFNPDAWTLRAAKETLAKWEGTDAKAVFLGDPENTVRAGVKALDENITRLPSVPVPADLGEGGSA